MRLLFTQEPVATSAGLFLGGAAGEPGPWRRQAILGRGRWDADALREMVPEYVVEHLADVDAVLVIEKTGFLKQGKRSCGLGRQYTGGAGKTPTAGSGC